MTSKRSQLHCAPASVHALPIKPGKRTTLTLDLHHPQPLSREFSPGSLTTMPGWSMRTRFVDHRILGASYAPLRLSRCNCFSIENIMEIKSRGSATCPPHLSHSVASSQHFRILPSSLPRQAEQPRPTASTQTGSTPLSFRSCPPRAVSRPRRTRRTDPQSPAASPSPSAPGWWSPGTSRSRPRQPAG